MIGKLEETILLAALRAGANAVPSRIYDWVVSTTPPGEKAPAFGAVYTTIGRMADKKMLSEGKMVDEHGRDRRTFTVAAAGQSALDLSLRRSDSLRGGRFVGALA
jgi:hypothetical protein